MLTAQTGRTHGCTDQPAGVKKVLANPEPSTHGTSRTSGDVRPESPSGPKQTFESGRAHLAIYQCTAYTRDMSGQDRIPQQDRRADCRYAGSSPLAGGASCQRL